MAFITLLLLAISGFMLYKYVENQAHEALHKKFDIVELVAENFHNSANIIGGDVIIKINHRTDKEESIMIDGSAFGALEVRSTL